MGLIPFLSPISIVYRYVRNEKMTRIKNENAPIPPPRKSLNSSRENTPKKKKHQTSHVKEFTIENFVNQSLANEEYDSEDDDDSSCDPTPSKLSISQASNSSMANSIPDLVPLNESFGSDKKKNDYISPKIKSLLETLAKPKEKSL